MRNGKPLSRGPGILLVVLVVLASGACTQMKRAASAGLDTATDGTLTVATELPAPGFWDGNDPATVRGGFEWAVADALSKELGLKLTIVGVPFADIVKGRLGSADVALAQGSATPPRRDVADLTVPYFESSPAALAKAGGHKDLVDLQTARTQRWAVQRATTLEAFLHDVVRPDVAPLLFDGTDEVVHAVSDGRADVALLDLPTALAIAKTEGLSVPARFDKTEFLVGVLPKGSGNLD